MTEKHNTSGSASWLRAEAQKEEGMIECSSNLDLANCLLCLQHPSCLWRVAFRGNLGWAEVTSAKQDTFDQHRPILHVRQQCWRRHRHTVNLSLNATMQKYLLSAVATDSITNPIEFQGHSSKVKVTGPDFRILYHCEIYLIFIYLLYGLYTR